MTGPAVLRRAYTGARSVVLVGIGAGAALGLVTPVPLVLAIGAGAIVAVSFGGLVGLARS